MRELTDSERETMQTPLREYWVEKDGLLPKETRAFEAGFTAALDHSASEIAAYILSLEGLQAENEGLREALAQAVKDLTQIVKSWRDYASEDYCTITNPEMGNGLKRAANHLGRYVNEARRGLEK